MNSINLHCAFIYRSDFIDLDLNSRHQRSKRYAKDVLSRIKLWRQEKDFPKRVKRWVRHLGITSDSALLENVHNGDAADVLFALALLSLMEASEAVPNLKAKEEWPSIGAWMVATQMIYHLGSTADRERLLYEYKNADDGKSEWMAQLFGMFPDPALREPVAALLNDPSLPEGIRRNIYGSYRVIYS